MAAGDSVTMLRPWFYRGASWGTRSVVQPMSSALRAAWPSGWSREKGFQNGVTVNLQKPMAAIQTSDLGIVGYVSTGAHGMQVQAQFRLPTAGLLQRLGSFYVVSVDDGEVWSFDPTDELGAGPTSEFRVGIEGISNAGGLFAAAKKVVFVGFRGQQGGNIAMRFDHSGNDAGLFPTMTLQLLPYTAQADDLTGSGVTVADVKSLFGILYHADVA